MRYRNHTGETGRTDRRADHGRFTRLREVAYRDLPTEGFASTMEDELRQANVDRAFAPALTEFERKRMAELQRRLDEGTYWVSAEDLAPILTDIFFCTGRSA